MTLLVKSLAQKSLLALSLVGLADCGGSSAPTAAEVALACVPDDRVVDQTFVGPGWDAAKGMPVGTAQASYVASATRIVAKTDPAGAQLFGSTAQAVIGQAMSANGLVGFSFAHSAKCGYSETLLLWKSRDNMMAFVMSGAHLNAINHATDVGTTGKVTAWDIAAATLPPTWPIGDQQLAAVPPIF